MATQLIESAQVEQRRSFPDILARMDRSERIAAYRAGVFNLSERAAWAANYPDEVPLVNKEFEWIALNAE